MRSTKQVKYLGNSGRNELSQVIVVIGFMGCGKSTLGRQLARQLGRRFLDLDAEIVRLARGLSIPEIFAEEGEQGFRRRETEALKGVLASKRRGPGIVALGGGTVLKPQNRALLGRSKAFVIWVDVPWAEVWRRLSKLNPRRRPLLWNGEKNRAKSEREVRLLWSERRKFYRSVASVSLRIKGEEAAGMTTNRVIGLTRSQN